MIPEKNRKSCLACQASRSPGLWMLRAGSECVHYCRQDQQHDALRGSTPIDRGEAEGTVRSLVTRLRVLRADLQSAKSAAARTRQLARDAEQACAQVNLDQRSLTDHHTAALEREVEVVNFQAQYDADHLAFGIELDLGLPSTRRPAVNSS